MHYRLVLPQGKMRHFKNLLYPWSLDVVVLANIREGDLSTNVGRAQSIGHDVCRMFCDPA